LKSKKFLKNEIEIVD